MRWDTQLLHQGDPSSPLQEGRRGFSKAAIDISALKGLRLPNNGNRGHFRGLVPLLPLSNVPTAVCWWQ